MIVQDNALQLAMDTEFWQGRPQEACDSHRVAPGLSNEPRRTRISDELGGTMGECTRTMRLEVPADQVWEWLKVPQNAFAVNMFHAEVEYDGDTVEKGSTLRVLP